MKRVYGLVLLAAVLSIGATAASGAEENGRQRVALIVLDGLRPDDVTPERMPRLTALSRSGVVYASHHAIFPASTMVNAASMATGTHPDEHGLTGNVLWTPGAEGHDASGRSLDYLQPVDIDDWMCVSNLDRHYGGRLLRRPSLGERLAHAGRRVLVLGKSDPAFLFDPRRAGFGLDERAVWPEALAQRLVAAGHRIPRDSTVMWPGLRLPETNGDPTARSPRITMVDGATGDPSRADRSPFAPVYHHLLDLWEAVAPDVDPDLTVFWIRDPDTTQHWYGLGTAAQLDALQQADRAVGRILDGLAAWGWLDSTNVMVTSDHGHSSVSGDLRRYPLRAIRNGRPAETSPDGFATSGEVSLRELLLEAGISGHVYDGGGRRSDPFLTGIPAGDPPVPPSRHLFPAAQVPESLEPDAIVIASNPGMEYVHLPGRQSVLVERVARFLQSRPEFGVVAVDDRYGPVEGCLPLSLLRLRDPEGRNPDLLAVYAADDSQRVRGREGTTHTGIWLRRGDHGSASLSNMRTTLIAAGPAFRKGVHTELPSCTADIAPTAAALLGIPREGMSGRSLDEGFRLPARRYLAASSGATYLAGANAGYRSIASFLEVVDEEGRIYRCLGEARAAR